MGVNDWSWCLLGSEKPLLWQDWSYDLIDEKGSLRKGTAKANSPWMKWSPGAQRTEMNWLWLKWSKQWKWWEGLFSEREPFKL